MRGAQPATSAVPDFVAGSPVPAFLTVLATAKKSNANLRRAIALAGMIQVQRPCSGKSWAEGLLKGNQNWKFSSV